MRRLSSSLLLAALLTAVPPDTDALAAPTDGSDRPTHPTFGLLPPERPDLGTESDSDWADLRNTFRELRFHIAHPTMKEGLSYAGLVLGALYLERNKYEISADFQEDRNAGGDRVSSNVRPLGEAIVPIAAFTTYAVGRFSGSDKTRRVGLILSESALFTTLATEVGQFILSEQRPEEGGKLRFFAYGGHGVSGHTSIIASMSVPLDRLFFTIDSDDNGWLKAAKYAGKGVVYSLPVLTGWSRLNDNKHFAWNALLGLGTGYMIGSFVSSAHGLHGSDRPRDWSVVPITDDHGSPGLALRWTMR